MMININLSVIAIHSVINAGFSGDLFAAIIVIAGGVIKAFGDRRIAGQKDDH